MIIRDAIAVKNHHRIKHYEQGTKAIKYVP